MSTLQRTVAMAARHFQPPESLWVKVAQRDVVQAGQHDNWSHPFNVCFDADSDYRRGKNNGQDCGEIDGSEY